MPTAENDKTGIDVDRFATAMQKPNFDAELFFPLDRSAWVGDHYQLNESARKKVVKNSGVRFQDTTSEDDSSRPREQVQWDMSHVVSSLMQLRSSPGMESVVVSRDCVRSRDKNKVDRIKFGLTCDDAFVDESTAAKATHANFIKVIHKSGFRVEHPKQFDPATGMNGLLAWAKELSLKKKWRPPWWWYFIPLLFLLLWLRGCDSGGEFIGIPVETKSLVIIIDQSSSMDPYMQQVRDEAKQLLSRWENTYTSHYINVIAYNDNATSALGDLQVVDQKTADRLNGFLDTLQMSGGTKLESAIDVASEEIARHDRPVTAIVLTDGEDNSIGSMLQQIQTVKDKFNGVDVTVKTCTPRLFNGGDPTPVTPAENGLKDFATQFGGSFGSEGGTP
ncbi:von Willebrand factor type A domain protein [Rubripirellula obstinata]|uniref:von Willebrand factor type A domain protein n=1 Tax=Rubripirellula obstinata TaxID=406547 RepID=A0A5B1CCL0_9BACT|nr:vWA domain-containing protein [Rubripirellula obstinata]KAA1257971.1 von Willebrand factor type A domain protein [Rubripirellula obstinata]